jgi:hypothetical protein
MLLVYVLVQMNKTFFLWAATIVRLFFGKYKDNNRMNKKNKKVNKKSKSKKEMNKRLMQKMFMISQNLKHRWLNQKQKQRLKILD